MGHRNVRFVIVLLALLAVASLAPVFWRQTTAVDGRVYTVDQVSAGLAAHPKAWIGRTILIRGNAYRCPPTIDCAYSYALASPNSDLLLGDNPPNPIIQTLRGLPLIGEYIVGPAYWRGEGVYRVRLRYAPGCGCLEGLVVARVAT